MPLPLIKFTSTRCLLIPISAVKTSVLPCTPPCKYSSALIAVGDDCLVNDGRALSFRYICHRPPGNTLFQPSQPLA
uniref:Uncharacterized protein n=1 Tax=Salix viminalis TaxID=40686 RepID=A0A6N2M1F3_SALVM